MLPESVKDAGHSAGSGVKDAGHAVANKTQGNPLAAGLIAFGVGMLVAALIPPSDKERELAATVEDKAQPLVEGVKDAAREVGENLREPAREAVDSVKVTAQDAAHHVADDAKAGGETVADEDPATAGQRTAQVRHGLPGVELTWCRSSRASTSTSPCATAYNQWTQFESFPQLPRGGGVDHPDRRHALSPVEGQGRGGFEREFDTEITEQHPDERVAWHSTGGDTEHAGVVTFHLPRREHHPCDCPDRLDAGASLSRRRELMVGAPKHAVKKDLENFKEFIEEPRQRDRCLARRCRSRDGSLA